MIKIQIAVVTIGICLIWLIVRVLTAEHKIDRQSIEICSFYAPIRKEEYKDTKWKDMDFYQSCIDNIECTTPVIPCEKRK